MNDQPINFNMTDTEYAALLEKGYDPLLEQRLIALGQNPEDARDFTRFLGMVTKKPPTNDVEWEEVCCAHGCEALQLDREGLMVAWSEAENEDLS
ncbi:hypothetical protein DSM106972_017490 [Dulcicalothrix desertica PCC 7102]|uniref:Uncharacterized protein n=1 Tax=Dulcicalothrix desertica PCC 7102 TaxID=232991 RepID=A0A433VR93_9CYAN|nr:hypothetical protein [Dulcicalothrix desertica]RUT08581.1 hypothetical protein DSM106972_017490 [Dulcicalothrix desertica PCC 7102]TWH44057.1 hypothetical protein CAL7102_07828 [Dulcicalothrix desertica PCC 7102]